MTARSIWIHCDACGACCGVVPANSPKPLRKVWCADCAANLRPGLVTGSARPPVSDRRYNAAGGPSMEDDRSDIGGES